jgi:two-component SAPR family response regulator
VTDHPPRYWLPDHPLKLSDTSLELVRSDFNPSGIDAVNDLLVSFEVPVIFITAYPERFLTGERPEPAFLIAKPFQPATVSAVISQVLFFERKAKRPQRRVSA